MVTHNATMLEQHLVLAAELPTGQNPRARRRMLTKEDPMSHRIIEKRRRDRMNNCLADLSRLIPADYLKKGRGRIEKTEIIEMAIKHMKYLQAHACRQMDSCELVPGAHHPGPVALEHYRLGYQECLSEAMHFMVEVEGYFAGDPLCVQLINHLQKHCDKLLNGDRLNSPRTNVGESSSSSGSSGGYRHNQHTVGSSSGFGSGSSPGSGSGSDSGNKEPNHSNQPIPTPVTDIPSDEQEEIQGSQLREMLQEYPPAPPSTLPLPVEHGSTPSLYKFKNNIKQRFTAEHTETSPAVNNYSSVKRRKFEVEGNEDISYCANIGLQNKRRDSETCSVPSLPSSPKYNPPRSPSPEALPYVSPPPNLKVPPAPSHGVPIFALHSKGSFYIPLTLDTEVLAPYLAAFGVGLDGGNPNSVVLHPVTISVNFQQTKHVRLSEPEVQHVGARSVAPWKSEMTFPKWSVCAQDRG